jgi:hypothetical protein
VLTPDFTPKDYGPAVDYSDRDSTARRDVV